MTYQPDTLTEARFNGTSNSHLLTLINQANSNALNAIRSLNEFRTVANTKFSLLTDVEALRQEVAYLKSVQQDTFNMAVRAVAEVLVSADKAGSEDAETMGEKMLAMIRKGGAA